jgi:hypothetical protein
LGVHSHYGSGIIYRARIGRPPDKPISTIGFLVHPLVRRAVLAMIDKDRKTSPDGSTPRLAPRIRTEYDRLCEELGGPADIGVAGISDKALASYCRAYPSHCVLPVLSQYQRKEKIALRHWPWAAFAISLYDHETKKLKTYSDEPTPKKVEELLSKIEKSAKDLNAGLRGLEILSDRLRDPIAPHRRGHLGWLDAVISQAAAGFPAPDVNESAEHLFIVDAAKTAFLQRLADVEGVTKGVLQHFNRKLLQRERAQSNPALWNFVFRCSAVWRGLTDRKPSANKITRRDGSNDPDFVIFLQRLAQVAAAPVPTRNQVALCLQDPAPVTTVE